MPNLFTLIGSSWDFARKQPTVLPVLFWFVFLPTLAGNLLTDYQMTQTDILRSRPEFLLAFVLGQILLALVLLWGMTCLLSIGKRLLQAKAGRTRTSFKTVRIQARAAFFPLLLTGILRNILTILWGLLLIVPGIIYFFRTAFYPVVVVCEEVSYRPALQRCKDISKGQLGAVTLTVIGLTLLTLTPAQLLSGLFFYLAKDLPLPALVSAEIASSLLFAIALMLYLFCLIGAYDWFRPKSYVKN